MNMNSTQDPFREYAGRAITELPPKQWLIDQIVGKEDFVMLFGESGAGKSFMAVELAMCGITGQTFAGHFEVKKPIRVAYMTNEGVSGLGQRFNSAAQKHKPTDGDWSLLHVFTDLLQFTIERGDYYLDRFISQWKDDHSPEECLDLLILDHLSGTLPGKGDSDGGAATILHQGVARLKRALGTSIVMIHHTGYDRSHSRGMTTYKDISDVQIQIKGTKNPRTMVCAKNKDSKPWNTEKFELVEIDDSCYINWTGPAKAEALGATENRYITILAKAGKMLTSAEIAEKAGVTQHTAENVLWELYNGEMVRRELKDCGRVHSKTNPYLYALPE